MAELKELLEQGRKLGEAIADHAKVRAFLDARQAATQSADAQKVLREYQEHVDRVRRLEYEQKPIEVADKRKLVELEGKMASQEQLKQLMRTQADYLDLMNQVNRAIEAPLVSTEPPDKSTKGS